MWMEIRIERVPSGHKGRADRDDKIRISAIFHSTHVLTKEEEAIPSRWLTEERARIIARAYLGEWSEPKVNWYDTYLREIKQESHGVWTVWVFQEWLD